MRFTSEVHVNKLTYQYHTHKGNQSGEGNQTKESNWQNNTELTEKAKLKVKGKLLKRVDIQKMRILQPT